MAEKYTLLWNTKKFNANTLGLDAKDCLVGSDRCECCGERYKISAPEKENLIDIMASIVDSCFADNPIAFAIRLDGTVFISLRVGIEDDEFNLDSDDYYDVHTLEAEIADHNYKRLGIVYKDFNADGYALLVEVESGRFELIDD